MKDKIIMLGFLIFVLSAGIISGIEYGSLSSKSQIKELEEECRQYRTQRNNLLERIVEQRKIEQQNQLFECYKKDRDSLMKSYGRYYNLFGKNPEKSLDSLLDVIGDLRFKLALAPKVVIKRDTVYINRESFKTEIPSTILFKKE